MSVGGRAEVGGDRQPNQVRLRVEAETHGQVQDQRRERDADHVIDQECGQHAGEEHGRGEERERRPYARQRPRRQPIEEVRQPEEADDDHHAEQERDGGKIDGINGLLEGEQPTGEHQRGTDPGDARAVHAQPWHSPCRQAQVGQGKEGNRQPEGGVFGHSHYHELHQLHEWMVRYAETPRAGGSLDPPGSHGLRRMLLAGGARQGQVLEGEGDVDEDVAPAGQDQAGGLLVFF